ncbi:MAG: hypothetical protein K8R99_10470 [Actinomycetia bacterium]|nr:hypothetical protein [Actinomycetes bacterium]
MTNKRLFRSVVGVFLIAVSAGCVPKQGTEGVKDAATNSCAAERHLVEQAVEAYYILEGANPTAESLLVPNYLRTESASMDLDAAGNVVAAPGSGCT